MTATGAKIGDSIGESLDGSAAAQEQWHRLSPRMLLIHPIMEVGRALPALAGIFLAGSSHGHHLWGLVATGVVVVLGIVRWFTTRLRITNDQVQLRHGLVRRRTIATARARIRTVDVTSHVLHRALGLARVVIGTGTNERRGGGRIVLDGLSADAAGRLRDELLDHAPTRPATTAAAAAGNGPAHRELASLDRRWIRFAPFTLSGVVTGLVIWGLYWRVQGESGVDLARTGPLRNVSDWLARLPTATAVFAILGALLAFVAVTSTAGYVLAFWDFRLVWNDNGTLQITRGLLTTRSTSIERRRLVGIQLAEPLPLRLVGAARTTAIATGLRTGRGTERGGEVLLPPAPLDTARLVATRTLDGSPAVTAIVRRHGVAAVRRRWIRAVGAAALITTGTVIGWLAGAPGWLPVIGVLVLTGSIPLARDRDRSLGHVVTDGYLVTSGGSLVRRRAVIANTSVIGWNLRSTPFQRRLRLVTATATTAAGRQAYRVQDIGLTYAVLLATEVTPGLLEQFRDRGCDKIGPSASIAVPSPSTDWSPQ